MTFTSGETPRERPQRLRMKNKTIVAHWVDQRHPEILGALRCTLRPRIGRYGLHFLFSQRLRPDDKVLLVFDSPERVVIKKIGCTYCLEASWDEFRKFEEEFCVTQKDEYIDWKHWGF